METDFNFKNKLIYGCRMLDVTRKYRFMPEEIYSEQRKTADNDLLSKILFYDIVWQSRCTAALSSIDAANCYDSAFTLIGMAPPCVIWAQARRLNTNIPRADDKYVDKLEKEILQHNIIPRLGAAHKSSSVKAIVKERVDKTDKETKHYMTNAEKKCRRIKAGQIPFSQDSAVWIRCCHVYRFTLRYHAGLIRNRGNLKRAAWRCGIERVLQLPLHEVRVRLKICKNKCAYFWRHGHRYQQKHLNNWLDAARQRQDEEAETKILAIIQREKHRSYWGRLNYSMSKPKGRSVRIVQTSSGDDLVAEHDIQHSVENTIWSEIHDKWFYLAG